MSDHTAASYVYRVQEGFADAGKGYVGRCPQQAFPGQGVELIGRRGATMTDEEVKALGLSDLDDHTDYGHTADWETQYTLPPKSAAVRDGRAKGKVQKKPKAKEAGR